MFPVPLGFIPDTSTNYNHSGIAPGVLSVFTTDRLTKVQSHQAASDLESELMRNPKQVFRFFSSCLKSESFSALSNALLGEGNTINYLGRLLKPKANRHTEELSNSNKTIFNKTITKPSHWNCLPLNIKFLTRSWLTLLATLPEVHRLLYIFL